MNPNKFPPEQRDAVYRAINERRDMRHFLPGPIDSDTLQRLLEAAHAAPSDFNPVLLKPNTDTGAQVIIHGKALTEMHAVEFHDYKPRAMKKEGALSVDGQILSTYAHGLFDHQEAREALLNWAGLNDGFTFDYRAKREQEINRLADAIEQALDIDLILQSVNLA